MLFHVWKHKFQAEKHMFQDEKHKFHVRKHKNHFVAETFGGLNGKKCRTERKEKPSSGYWRGLFVYLLLVVVLGLALLTTTGFCFST